MHGHLKGADSMAISGLCFGNALVSSGWPLLSSYAQTG